METPDQIREKNRWNPKPAPQKQESNKEIPPTTIALMFCLAGLFDAVQALLSFFAIGLAISPFISVFAGMCFWFWFSVYGISFIEPKRLTALLGGGIAEMVPAVDALPFWIGIVWYIVNTTKMNNITSNIPGVGGIMKKIK